MSNKRRQQQHSKQAVTAAVPGGANRDGVEASALVAGPSPGLEASADGTGVSIQLEGLEVADTQVYEVSLKNVETARVRAVDEAGAIAAYFAANGILATDHIPLAAVSSDQEGLAIGDESGESSDDQS